MPFLDKFLNIVLFNYTVKMKASILNKLSPEGREQIILLEGKLRKVEEKLLKTELDLIRMDITLD